MAFPHSEGWRPLRRVEFNQLAALGAFQDERIELLDGELVRMTPPNPPHGDTIEKLQTLLTVRLVGRARVRGQLPFAAGDLSQPEPDIAVLPLGGKRAVHPDRAHLLIEVSDSSLAQDRGQKARLYSECGVPEYWVCNLVDSVVEVHREPSASGYHRVSRHELGSRIAPEAFPDVDILVDEFLT